MLEQKWSFKYNECLSCGRNDRPHDAKGYCKPCYRKNFSRNYHNEYMKEYRKTHPQKNSNRKMTNTGFKYSDAPTPRANKCEICSREGKTVLDHCHRSNKFRGWLCNQCNTSLGMVKDRIEILHKMIEYLVKNS